MVSVDNVVGQYAPIPEGAGTLTTGPGRFCCPLTSMPTCLIVQHVAPESAFAIAEALSRAEVEIDTRRVFAGAEVPRRCPDVDGLVIMGGPMSAHSDEGFPSRETELQLIADAVDRGIPTLGVCLGAQLLAVAAGGSVSAGASGPEIGWGPVQLLPACAGDGLFDGLPDTLTVMHWHGDTFSLPPGSERLIGNANYPNQGFRLGDRAWGVQFHLEVTEAAVDEFITAFAADAASVDGGADAIRAATPRAVADLSKARDRVCQCFAGLVAAHASRDDPILL
jgi:GMP synthase-like glutamine amidotransferase